MGAPTRPKRRLGKYLMDLRERAGRILLDAAGTLRTAESSVQRYESGEIMPTWPTVSTLLSYYGADDDQRAEASRLWEAAREAAPSVRLPKGTSKAFRTYVGAESEGTLVRTIEVMIPGLLQTELYQCAVHAAGLRFHEPNVSIDRYVATRVNRQRRLKGPNRLTLHSLVDVAGIRRLVGGRAAMRAQLEHLLEAMSWDNVTLQLIPDSVGAYGCMPGGVHIVSGPDADDGPGLYLEHPAGGIWVDNEADVGSFTATFEDVTAIALSTEESAEMIRQQIRKLDEK